MSTPAVIALVVAGLILLRLATELWLARLNRRHVLRHAGEVPEPFREFIDPPTYARSVEYTLVRRRFNDVADVWNTVILLAVLFSGVLPWAHERIRNTLGDSVWAMSAFLVLVGFVLSLTGLPFEWHAQFRIEERFGFNTTTPKTWWLDRVKGWLLGAMLGYPLVALILYVFHWAGEWWWLWAWAVVVAFQLLLAVLAPVLILPLFNKFTPLPEGSLKERLLRLAKRTAFRARSIQVMDGSRRSRHSNAFFTGFGRLRKIVLFDTLIAQLTEPELEAVLAHEIGHYKKKHIPRMLAFSVVALLAGFGVLAALAKTTWLYEAFGFSPGCIEAALLLFGLLSGVVTFWILPILHWWSRRHEYEADAYAASVMNDPAPLISALRKLNEKNLGNLTPHPVYSAFYYSHPALLEREAALRVKTE